jgi:hypothetical protein
MSWAALLVNVLILVFTSSKFRNRFIIPLVIMLTPAQNGARSPTSALPPDTASGEAASGEAAILSSPLFARPPSAPPSPIPGGGSASCFDPAFAYAFDATPLTYTDAMGGTVTMGANATISHHAAWLGLRTSFLAPCKENVMDCFADIGGVPWLPATRYLSPHLRTSQPYALRGLCNPSSALHNELHCQKCEAWRNDVVTLQWIVAIVVEHLLLLFKMMLAYVVPDKPQWVEDARARSEFQKSFVAHARHRQSTAAEEEREWLDRREAITQIDVCEPDGDDDGDERRPWPSGGGGGGMVRTNSRFSANL